MPKLSLGANAPTFFKRTLLKTFGLPTTRESATTVPPIEARQLAQQQVVRPWDQALGVQLFRFPPIRSSSRKHSPPRVAIDFLFGQNESAAVDAMAMGVRATGEAVLENIDEASRTIGGYFHRARGGVEPDIDTFFDYSFLDRTDGDPSELHQAAKTRLPLLLSAMDLAKFAPHRFALKEWSLDGAGVLAMDVIDWSQTVFAAYSGDQIDLNNPRFGSVPHRFLDQLGPEGHIPADGINNWLPIGETDFLYDERDVRSFTNTDARLSHGVTLLLHGDWLAYQPKGTPVPATGTRLRAAVSTGSESKQLDTGSKFSMVHLPEIISMPDFLHWLTLAYQLEGISPT